MNTVGALRTCIDLFNLRYTQTIRVVVILTLQEYCTLQTQTQTQGISVYLEQFKLIRVPDEDIKV